MNTRVVTFFVLKNLFYSAAFFASFVSWGANVNAQSAKFDTSYISDQSILVLRFDIGKLVAMEKVGSKNVEMISKELKKNVGLPLEEMKAITIQIGKVAEEKRSNNFSITFEQSKPIDKDAMHRVRNIDWRGLIETEYGGKKYLRDHFGGASVYFSNDRTVSVGHDTAMENLIDAEKGKGEMASQIRTAPPGSEVQVALRATEGFDQLVDDIPFLLNSPYINLPPDVNKVVRDAKTGVGSICTRSSTPLHIQIQFGAGDSATSAKTNLEKLVQLGKASIPLGESAMNDELKRLKGNPKNKYSEISVPIAELALKALSECKKLIDGVQIDAKQKTLTVKLKQMGGIKHIVPIVSDSFRLMFTGLE